MVEYLPDPNTNIDQYITSAACFHTYIYIHIYIYATACSHTYIYIYIYICIYRSRCCTSCPLLRGAYMSLHIAFLVFASPLASGLRWLAPKCRWIEEASAPAHAAPAVSITHLHRSRHKRSLLLWWSICLITTPTWISRQTRTGTRVCWELTSLAVTASWSTNASVFAGPAIIDTASGGWPITDGRRVRACGATPTWISTDTSCFV